MAAVAAVLLAGSTFPGASQGSVVAYEAVHRAYEQLPSGHTLTLMTLGSPLGLQGVVYNRLRPQPRASVTEWYLCVGKYPRSPLNCRSGIRFPPLSGNFTKRVDCTAEI